MLILQPFEVEQYLHAKGIRFKRRGQKAEADICPFCQGGDSHDKKTFVVYLDDKGGNYKCMRGSCGVAGSFWQLAEHFGDDPKSFYQSNGFSHTNGNRHHHQPPPREVKLTFKVDDRFELKPLDIVANHYLHQRGFTDETLGQVSIGMNPTGDIAFEYYHKGELCFVKCRKPRKPIADEPKAWAQWKEGLRTLWGLEQCDFSQPYIVITFGEYDRMAVLQAGMQNAVSVPSGDEDLDWINICWETLEKIPEIILWTDKDKSGEKALKTVAQRLGEHKIRVVRTEFKDANEMLYMRSKAVGVLQANDEVFEACRTAEWYFTGDIIRVADIPDREQDFTGYLTGFRFLNKALHGFLKGQLTVHTGDSKHGKSTALTQISAACMQQGARVCAWSGEDDRHSYKYRMDVHLAGFDGVNIRTSREGREYAALKPDYRGKVDKFIYDHLFLYDKRVGVTEENLIESFELAMKRHGCDVFIVDNLMKMVAAKETEQQYFRQAQIINKLSDFAKDNGVHLHIATHINKSGNVNEPPLKNTVSGAKEITNLADNVLSWWRIPEAVKDKFNGMDTLCSVLANRLFGDEPAQPLRYDNRIKRFGELSDDLSKIYLPENE